MNAKIYRKLKAKLTMKRVLVASFALIAFGFAMAGLIAGCEYLHFRTRARYAHYSLEKRVSEHITMVHGDKAGYFFCQLKDLRTGQFTTPKLNHVFLGDNAEDSLVVFRDYDRKYRGFVNTNIGRIIIPAQYDRAWNFSEGLAAVVKDGTISFLNEQGEQAFPTTFPLCFDDDHEDYAFVFHNGLCVMIDRNHKWGLINTRGEWVIEPVYTEISKPYLGYRIVCDGRHYGLLTNDGNGALPMEYDIIRRTLDGTGFFLAKNGYGKLVDRNLNTIVPFAHDGLEPLTYIDDYRSMDEYDRYGNPIPITPQYWRYDIGSKSGVVDREGNVIIPAVYFMVWMVDDNLFEAEVTYRGESILFDNKGRYVGKSNF